MKCSLCGSTRLLPIYEGKIRSGSYGKTTENDHCVLECSDCSLVFLKEQSDKSFYETEEYREQYNDSISVEDYQNRHDAFETSKITRIGLDSLREKVVADFGCGGGAFLDAAFGYARETIAVEPLTSYHSHLTKRHKTFQYGAELACAEVEVDVATSFDVIEHVRDFQGYLDDIKKSLCPNGVLYLMTPNFNDILTHLIGSPFSNFNFRTAHEYYFNKATIFKALTQSGFKNVEVSFIHKYDISNLIYWCLEGRPTGSNKTKIFDKYFNNSYVEYLERNMLASHLWVEAR